jgi:hypothetical protein
MRILFLMVSACAVAFLTGCGTTAKFTYPAKMSQLVRFGETPLTDKTVTVVPFEDFRSDDNTTMFGMQLIPLFPCGWGNYDRPDAARSFPTILEFEVTPTEDLPKATATSLRRSNLFKEAAFSHRKEATDYTLAGRIKTFAYRGKVWSWGLSVYGSYLWVLGAPAAVSENEIEVELELLDKNGKIVWEYTIRKANSMWQWLYYRFGHDCKMFAILYQDGMNAALTDLSQHLLKK